MPNTLYYGDNLSFLREFDRRSADLVYLDPPFNSKATYNLLYRTPQGDAVQAQTAAFKDTWTWETCAAAQAFDDVIASGSPAGSILRALRTHYRESDMMAYLSMMAVRLIEMRRILKDTGSLFIHCDPTASHYLKILLDGIFGDTNFRNEIIWKRKAGRGETNRKAIRFGGSHDVLLFYGVSEASKFMRQYRPSNPDYIKTKFTHIDSHDRCYRLDNLTSPSPRPNLRYDYKGYAPPANGWAVSRARMEEMEREGRLYFPDDKTHRIQRIRFLDELPGETVDDLWDDIPPLNSQAKERIGYPTQKPMALLQRVIAATTEPGQLVLDPFCGCGTTIEAAQSMGRAWTGIDITHHAIDVIDGRLERCGAKGTYKVEGRPENVEEARALMARDPYELQWWANWLIGAQNYREHKKGPDKGIDGLIYFRNGPRGVGQVIISVKGGENVGAPDVDALSGTMKREDAELGILICFEPTRNMKQYANGSGYVQTAQGRYQRLQLITIEDLLINRLPPLPKPLETEAFRQPLRPTRRPGQQQPDDQLEMVLPIPGGKTKSRPDVRDHLSGRLLARVAES